MNGRAAEFAGFEGGFAALRRLCATVVHTVMAPTFARRSVRSADFRRLRINGAALTLACITTPQQLRVMPAVSGAAARAAFTIDLITVDLFRRARVTYGGSGVQRLGRYLMSLT